MWCITFLKEASVAVAVVNCHRRFNPHILHPAPPVQPCLSSSEDRDGKTFLSDHQPWAFLFDFQTWTFVHNDKYVKTDLRQQRISSSGCPDEERTFKIKLLSECWNFLVFPPRVRSVRIFCYYHCRCSSSYYNLRGGVPFFWAVPKLQSLPLHAILATFQFWKLPK